MDARVRCSQILNAGPDFPCERCYKRFCGCVRQSARYITQFSLRSGAAQFDPHAWEGAGTSTPTPPPAPILVQPVPAPAAPVSALPAAAPTPATVLRSFRSRRAPAVAVAGSPCVKPSPPTAPSAGDASLDTGPAYDLLVGGPRGPAGVDPASTALFWCNELSRAEGVALAANRHIEFVRRMCDEAHGRCFTPPEDVPRIKRVKVSGPSRLDKGISMPRKKGKGRAKPIDDDETRVPLGIQSRPSAFRVVNCR